MLFTQRQGESQETPWGLRTGACHVADMGVGGASESWRSPRSAPAGLCRKGGRWGPWAQTAPIPGLHYRGRPCESRQVISP